MLLDRPSRILMRQNGFGKFLIAAFIAFLCTTSLGVSSAAADDWPGFHGLDHGGVLPGAKLPDGWEKQDFRWKIDLKTRDVGSMAIQNGRVFLLAMAPESPAIRLMAIDLASGKQVWTREFPQSKNHLHSRNTLASSTPATDDKYVYIAHSDREHTWMRCLDHDGNEVWQRDFGIAQSQHGFGTSPAVHGETLLLNFSQQAERVESGQPGTSRVIAMNRSTGETIWETPLTSTRVCYGVPVVRDGKVFGANTGDGLFALSLKTGKMLWRLPVFKMRCVSTPIVVDDLAIGSSGSGGGGNHMVAVRIPKDDTTAPSEVYRIERAAPYVPTSVVHDGAMYVIDDKGIASCFEVATGKVHWSNKRMGGSVGASPILLGDQVLAITLDGDATVFRASREFEKLNQVNLGGPVGATPAYADGRLLVRVGTELRCL